MVKSYPNKQVGGNYMMSQQMKIIFRLLHTTILLLIMQGCINYDSGWKLTHKEILNDCSRIIIRSMRTIESKTGTTFEVDNRIYADLRTSKALKDFKNLFKESNRGGYCCCPYNDFLIDFYKRDFNYVNYYVDTLNESNTALIYKPGFQYHYTVTLSDWLNFLNKYKN